MPDYLELGDNEEQYLTPSLGLIEENEVIVKIKEMTDALTLPAPAEPNTEGHGRVEKTDFSLAEDLSINVPPPLREIPPHHQSATANRERMRRHGPVLYCYNIFLVAMSKQYPSH
jgi:hypothetical protein